MVHTVDAEGLTLCFSGTAFQFSVSFLSADRNKSSLNGGADLGRAGDGGLQRGIILD